MPIPYAESLRFLERQAKTWEKSGDAPEQYDGWRPSTRADCASFARPCPFVGCRHHLFLDVGSGGAIKFNFGEDVSALTKMKDTCALDVAKNGGIQLEAIGQRLNVTRERARQQEAEAMEKLRQAESCNRPDGTEMNEDGYI